MMPCKHHTDEMHAALLVYISRLHHVILVLCFLTAPSSLHSVSHMEQRAGATCQLAPGYTRELN
jgi:hypothetical protein